MQNLRIILSQPEIKLLGSAGIKRQSGEHQRPPEVSEREVCVALGGAIADKNTYIAWELAEELGIKRWKVLDMLRRGQIRHTHINRTHAGARIPREELVRLLKGANRRSTEPLNRVVSHKPVSRSLRQIVVPKALK